MTLTELRYVVALAWRVVYPRSEAIDILIDTPRSQ